MKYNSSFFFIIVLFSFPFVNRAQVATEQQVKEVRIELNEFKKNWSEKLPYDSKFGIIQLSNLLNLDYPGMEKLKIAVDNKNWDNAEKELLEYFKTSRLYNKPNNNQLNEIELEAAESALNHYFRGNKDAHPLIYRGANIDWRSPAFHEGKEIKDAEWQFIFQRLLWWQALAKAHHLTKDEKYFDEWQYEMVDFANDILPVNDSDPRYITRGMETYYRCIRLRYVLPYFIDEDRFDVKTLLYFLTSFHMQAEHIRTVYEKDGNHLLGELSTVFENAIAFPEFKKSEEWIQETITRIPERMFIEIYPDGMNNELIFSYHSMYMRLFADAYVKFKENGYDKFLPKDYYARLVKMAEVYTYHMFPDNTISQFGDAWKDRDAAETFRKEVSKYAPDLPYFDFIASKGRKGTPPPKTSIAFPISGFYFFRSEWKPDAIFLSMKNNPNYSWHSQIDNGTFEFFAYGRNFMTDSGAYIYNSDDPEEQNWRKWFRSSIAHQTLTLNNKNVKIASKHIFWKESSNLTCLVNENKSYDNLNHRRTTIFVDNKYFLIYDQAIGDAEGDVRTHFQLVPCDNEIDENSLTIATKFDEGPNLIVKNFPTKNQIKFEKEEGWISYNVLRKEERPAWSFGAKKSKDHSEVTFLTGLFPYKENQRPDKVSASIKETDEGLNFFLEVGENKYHILINAEKKVAELRNQ